MKYSSPIAKENKDRKLGRVIAQGMQDVKVERKKHMAKQAEQRKENLEQQAEQALSGGN